MHDSCTKENKSTCINYQNILKLARVAIHQILMLIAWNAVQIIIIRLGILITSQSKDESIVKVLRFV